MDLEGLVFWSFEALEVSKGTLVIASVSLSFAFA